MMRPVPIAAACLILLAMAFSARADSTNATVFFDDFTTSQLSPSWMDNPGGYLVRGNTTQEGGYLTITDNRFSNPSCSCIVTSIVVANQSAPVIDSGTNGVFLQMVVKERPFNMTGTSTSGINRIAETFIALSSLGGGGFGIQMVEEDSTAPGLQVLSSSGFGGEKQVVGLFFNKPNSGGGGTIHWFDTPSTVFGGGCCGVSYPTIVYSPNVLGNSIDLNAQHIFTLRMRLWQGTDAVAGSQSWVAMQVDNFGWLNMSQAACLCISPPSTNFATLYPMLAAQYCVTNGGGSPLCNRDAQSSQSVATSVDYVLITNYIPATLPNGQVLTSNITPPLSNPQPYTGSGGSLTAYIQYIANAVGGGNIYAGGMLLTAIVSVIIFVFLGLTAMRLNLGEVVFGFLYSLIALAIAFIAFYAGVVPVWLPAVEIIVVAGIMFGVVTVRGRGGGSGGGIVET